MANPDTPSGLKPVRYRSGAPYNGACNPYAIASDYGTALYVGDPVTRTGTANAAALTAVGAGSFPIGTLPQIEKTVAGDSNSDAERQTGVIVGFAASPAAGLDKQYNPASTARVAYVADDPNLVFEIQANGAIPAASIGLTAIFIYTHPGSTATGISGVELDTTGTAPAADASYQLRIVGAVNRPDNDTTLTHAKVLVMLNNHTEAHGMVDNAHGTLGI
jgi:hypothetical protein